MPNVLNSRKTRQLEVRIAQNQLEIEQALTLRYNVFNKELGEGLARSQSTGKDRDDFDLYCEHLIVIDKATSEVVGTYRILSKSRALQHVGFYSETEFDLTNIYRVSDEMAEVGRSCVHPDYRDGSVITLLWNGLAEYILKNNVRYLMGCGSLHSTDANEVNEVYAYLRDQNHLVDEALRVQPRSSHVHPEFREISLNSDIKAVTKRLPPLIKGYLRIGARIGGKPALDREFGTTDLFIFFDAESVTQRYGKRFLEP
ncbi:MAG: GNAT family N-acetyltransferase [Leptospirales bacterium]|nr:GNAT family N-acetyltransferase [Leptospirales bacterium]